LAASVHQEQSESGGPGPAYQSSSAGLDELLRTVLPVEVCAGPAPRQSGARGMGEMEA